MKTKLTKLFSLLMAGALVLSLAACSGAGDDANTTGAEESNQAPNASETFPPASDESKNPSDSTAEPGVSDASDTRQQRLHTEDERRGHHQTCGQPAEAG